MANQILVRSGTAAAWTSANPTLLQGEQGYETDTGLFKVGDGSTAWTSLKYSSLVIRAEYNNQTTTAATNLNYSTKVEDTNNAVTTGASWKFTAPLAGVYLITGTATNSAASQALQLYKGGSVYGYSLTTDATAYRRQFAFTIRLAATEYVYLAFATGATASATDAITITRIGS
jgi:Major tropism determinant N-terminal domain